MSFIHNIKQLKENRNQNKQLAGYKFRRQHSIGSYIVDFYCPKLKLAVELDGGQHNQEENINYDKERTRFLNSLNIKVIRYWNHEVLESINDVLDDIVNKMMDVTKPPL